MGRSQELESTVVGEDPIRTRCLSNQEGIGQVSLGVESRWNRRIDAPGDGLDPSCGQVVLELIACGILVSLVSAGGGQLSQGEDRMIGEEDFEVERRHQGSILWTVGVES